MAGKPLRLCRTPGCGELTRLLRCDKHAKERQGGTSEAAKVYDERRGSARQRGYTKRWEKARENYLARNPLCKRCLDAGRVTAAELVDHIEPVQSADDPGFYDEENWQSLCGGCHAVKTGEDKRAGKVRRIK